MKVLLVSAGARVGQQVIAALADRPDTSWVEVATPERALALLDERAGADERAGDAAGFDVVVADNDTTPTGGFFLAREMSQRALAGADVPPLVLLLARAQDAWLANVSGADAYVVKPVDPFDLAEVVEALAGGAPLPALPGAGGRAATAALDGATRE